MGAPQSGQAHMTVSPSSQNSWGATGFGLDTAAGASDRLRPGFGIGNFKQKGVQQATPVTRTQNLSSPLSVYRCPMCRGSFFRRELDLSARRHQRVEQIDTYFQGSGADFDELEDYGVERRIWKYSLVPSLAYENRFAVFD